ncbi:enoyl-CoA hydratase-related protein [Amycolatopsis australiensis]|uniref:Enoyl-CoA hydratase n=1 Tax=Amycolatopsis australiensis TaxID=546364 RepID=A0A1K1SAN1_9PSEU|nr:enoyl-CoA hydratase-related protein [Amycolatopsis australiensis]SFW81425.1 enoyl-CoA hydratase [Amycolatopsis australiensis]
MSVAIEAPADPAARKWRTLRVTWPPGGDLRVTIRGTGAGNVLGGTFWTELAELLDLAEATGRPGSIVLAGDGGTFSQGLDLRWYLTRLRRAARGRRVGDLLAADARRLQDTITMLARSSRAVIADIDGECTGAAFELVCACDVRYASARTWFSLPEAELGLVADLGGLQRLPRLLGEGLVRELALGCGRLGAARAARIGLVNGTPAELTAFAGRVRVQPPAVVAELKRQLEAPHEQELARGLERAAGWNTGHAADGLPARMRARLAGGPEPRR